MEINVTIVISWMLWILNNQLNAVSAQTRIEATAPLEEVEEGAILSVHCQVWELEDGHEVTLFRELVGQNVQRVSVGNILTYDDDRLFLATRQLGDGSVVFFLSVMEVTRADQGTYRCQIYDPVKQKPVAVSEVYINVMYFPHNQYPVCSHKQPLRVMEGNDLVLNCTFPKGNPAVKLEWNRAATSKDMKAKTQVTDTHVFSLLTVRPRLEDSGSVYICTASSVVFPDETPTCHFGQITVTRNPHGSIIPRTPPTIIVDPTIRHATDCPEVCNTSTINSPVFKWIICTTIAGIIALTFFVIVIISMWKYYHVQNTSRNVYVTARPQLSEQVYSELECKRSDNLTYMSLTKEDVTKRLNQQFITKYCPREQQYDDKA